MANVVCFKCQTPLNEPTDLPAEQRRPCPACGSTRRTFMVPLEGVVTMKSELRLKQRRPGERRPLVEVITGDNLFRKVGRWMKKQRRIDRENDRYFERVADPATGETIHSCDEPLSDHSNHGFAKTKPPDVS